MRTQKEKKYVKIKFTLPSTNKNKKKRKDKYIQNKYINAG